MEEFIIETGNETHPEARITGVDLVAGRVDFKWVNGPDNKDHSVFYAVSPFNFVADCTAAVQSVLAPAEGGE